VTRGTLASPARHASFTPLSYRAGIVLFMSNINEMA
jgi:hypothetical protein